MRAGFFLQLVDDADIPAKDICRKNNNVPSTTYCSQIIHDLANMSTNHFNIGSNINKYVLYVMEIFSMPAYVAHLLAMMCKSFEFGLGARSFLPIILIWSR